MDDDNDLHLADRDALVLRHHEVAHSRIAFDRGDGDGYISAALHRLRSLCNPPCRLTICSHIATLHWFGTHTVFLELKDRLFKL
jgi:hypothetical protein